MKEEFCIMPKGAFYSTERFAGSHRHEVFFGSGNRELSIEDGLVVFLTPKMHNASNKGVHFDREFNLYLKKRGQIAWMEYYGKSEDDFIARYGRSYL